MHGKNRMLFKNTLLLIIEMYCVFVCKCISYIISLYQNL